MSLKITRDAQGNVTITDTQTGKFETITASDAARPAEKTLVDAQAMPSHSWSVLPSHSWGELPSHSWSNIE
jgi:hypothetical protein